MGVREQLLAAAEHLFYYRGLTATGVDTLSAAAGVGKMSLYHHFGSKDGLITAYLTRRDKQWQAHLDNRLATAGADPVDRLHAIVAAYEDRVAEPGYRGCMFLNAAAELAEDHPAREVVAAHKNRVRQQLRRYLVEAGAGAEAENLAAHLFTLLEGMLAVATVDPTGPDAQASRERAHRLIDQVGGDRSARGSTTG